MGIAWYLRISSHRGFYTVSTAVELRVISQVYDLQLFSYALEYGNAQYSRIPLLALNELGRSFD